MRQLYSALLCFSMIALTVNDGLCLLIHEYSLSKLWKEADLVVRGEIIGQRVQRQRGRIFTSYEVSISSVFQMRSPLLIDGGKSQQKIECHLPGGVMGDLSQAVSGIPQLQAATEYVIFLRCPQPERCVPLGYGQGIWRAIDDAQENWKSLSSETIIRQTTSPMGHNQEVNLPVERSLTELLRGHHALRGESQPHSRPTVAQP